MRLPRAIIGSILLGTAQAQEVTETNRPLGTLLTQTLPHIQHRPEDFVELPDGDLVLLANLHASVVVRLKPDGSQRWAKTLPEHLSAMMPLPDGKLLLVGAGASSMGADFATTMVWLDASGEEMLRKTVGGGGLSQIPTLATAIRPMRSSQQPMKPIC